MSPPLALFDEAVQGYPDDLQPRKNGVDDMLAITVLLESKNITCCIVDVPALNYYGAKRVVLVCVFNPSNTKSWRYNDIVHRIGSFVYRMTC
jgi:hypothetical protein